MVDDKKPTFEEFLQKLFIQSQAKLTKLLQDDMVRAGNEKEPYRFKTVLDSGLDLRDSQGKPINLHDFPIVGKIQQLCEKVEGYDDKVASYLSIYLVKAINDFMRTVSDEPTSARKYMVRDIIDTIQESIDSKKAELSQKTDEFLQEQLKDKDIRDAVSALYKGLDTTYSTITSDEVSLKDMKLHKEDIVLKSMYRKLMDTYEGISPNLIGLARSAIHDGYLDTSKIMVDSVDSDKFAYHIVTGGYLDIDKHNLELSEQFKSAVEEKEKISLLYVSGDSLDIEQKKSDKFLEAYSKELKEVQKEWKSGIKSELDLKAIQNRALKNLENTKALETAFDIVKGLGGKIIIQERSIKDRDVIKTYTAENITLRDNAVYARIEKDGSTREIKILELGENGYRAVAQDKKTYFDVTTEFDRAGLVMVDGIVSELTLEYLEKLSASDYVEIVSMQKEERSENGVERKTNLSLKEDIDTVAKLLDIKYATGFDKIDDKNRKYLDKASIEKIGTDMYILLEADDAKGGAVILEGMGDTAKMAAKEVRYAIDTIKIMEEKGVNLLPGLNAAYMAMYRTINENLDTYKENAQKEITEKLKAEMKTRIELDVRGNGTGYIENSVNSAIDHLKDAYGEEAASDLAEAFVKMDGARGNTYVSAKEKFYKTMADAYKSLVELVVPQDVVRELETRGSDLLGVTNTGYIRNALQYEVRDGNVVATPYVMLSDQVDIRLPGHYALEAISDILAL